MQSQCENAKFDPNDIKIPEIFQIWTWPPWLRPIVQIFISIPFSGASLQIGEILRFCDFFLVILYFSRARAQFEPMDRDSHRLWLIRRRGGSRRWSWGQIRGFVGRKSLSGSKGEARAGGLGDGVPQKLEHFFKCTTWNLRPCAHRLAVIVQSLFCKYHLPFLGPYSII